MTSTKRALLLAAALIATLWTAGCTKTTGGGGKIDAAFCSTFRPISWSANDTPETIAQAKAHNAVGAAVCGWRPS